MSDEIESLNPPAGEPVEQVAVTGRPADEPQPNTTFADRAKAAAKAVTGDTAENKAVKKATARKK
jgi:hypothetical protein